MRNSYILLILLLCSCSAENISPLNEISTNRKIDSRAIEQTVSPTLIWEDTIAISLSGYNDVILPWYNASDANIPNELLEDYQKRDGWELVYNLCSPSAATSYGKYYLIFYNKLRGILRVFYYNIYDTSLASTTFWQLAFTKPTAMLNNIGHFTIPANVNNTNMTYTTNITRVESKAISRGWNCFDVELTYDPNTTSQNTKFGISSHNVIQGTLNIQGSLLFESEGTIVSTGSTPRFPILSGMIDAGISGFGESVKNMVTKDLDSAKISPLISGPVANIISKGATGLLESGINWVFGSFLTKKTTTTQTLKVKTTGTITENGTFGINSSSNIPPLVNLVCPGTKLENSDYFLPSYNEPLGLWNLTEAPTVSFSSGAIWEKSEGSSSYTYNRIVKANPVNVIVNPYAEKYFSRYTVEYRLMYYKRFDGDDNWGKEYNDFYYSNSQYIPPIEGKKIYDDGKNVFLDSPYFSYGGVYQHHHLAIDCSREEREIWFLNNVPIENPNYVVKVMVTFYPKEPYDTTPIISSRTYIPQYIIEEGLVDPNGWSLRN